MGIDNKILANENTDISVIENINNTISTFEIINNQLEKIETRKFENQFKKYFEESTRFDMKESIKKVAVLEYNFSIKDFFIKIISNIKDNVFEKSPLIIKIGILAMFSGFIKVLSESFKNKDMNDIVYLIIYISIISLVYVNFLEINNLINRIIEITLNLIKLAIPILTSLLIASGKIKTAAFFEPVTFAFFNIMSVLLMKIYIPIILTLLNLIIINNISKKDIIKELIDMLKKLIENTLKFLISFIFGISIINKVSTSLFDGTIKNMLSKGISNLIPVVGKGIEGTLDIVLNCANLVKNSSGIVIIISYLVAIFKPLISIIAFIVIYRITLILVEPVAETRVKDLIKDIGDIITFSFSTIILVILIFVVNMTMIFS